MLISFIIVCLVFWFKIQVHCYVSRYNSRFISSSAAVADREFPGIISGLFSFRYEIPGSMFSGTGFQVILFWYRYDSRFISSLLQRGFPGTIQGLFGFRYNIPGSTFSGT